MRTRRQATIKDLRQAIDSLPRDTRVAMLDGIRQNEIIVGAYTQQFGICPMLAAYRAGGRAGCISFANAWDSFAFRGTRARLARRATRRELLVLTSHLEASLLDEDGAAGDLGTAIAQHEQLLQARPKADGPRTTGIPRLQTRPGLVFLRITRRLDEDEPTPVLVGCAGGGPDATQPQRAAELVPSG